LLPELARPHPDDPAAVPCIPALAHGTGRRKPMTDKTPSWAPELPTAMLVLADGTVIEGRGAGAAGSAVAEVCFNTAMTGYQEILTDPSYAGQIVTSPSRISAMSARTRKTWRISTRPPATGLSARCFAPTRPDRRATGRTATSTAGWSGAASLPCAASIHAR